MGYFSDTITYVKKHPLRTVATLGLDVLFYILLIPMFIFSLNLIYYFLSSFPLQSYGLMMGSMEGMQGILDALWKMFFGILLSIIVLFLLLFINIAIIKPFIWNITMKKKLTLKAILKGAGATSLIMGVLLIPLILSIGAYFYGSFKSLELQQPINIVYAVPFFLVVLLANYFLTLAFFHAAKEGKVIAAFKRCFRWNARMLFPPIILIVVIGVLFKLLSYIAMPFIGGIFLFVALLAVSFMNRIFIVENS